MEWTLHERGRHIADKDISIDEILEILMAIRGVDAEQAASFLSPDYDRDTHDPFLFQEMEAVVERLRAASEKGEMVGVFGDHDVDGVSATTLMVEGLEMIGIQAQSYIPCKNEEGHGVNKAAIDQFAEVGVTLMVTVDCGIGDVEMVAYARSCDIETIIVDHHQIPERLPEAYAIINPHLADSGYPFKDLCGAACAFKVVHALCVRLAPEKVEQLKWLLDIVAIATVADCMPLIGENRAFVVYGLLVLSKTRRVSLQQMISVGEMDIGPHNMPDAHTIGFHIGPRLNAAGRMSHAREAYDFLAEKDPAMARVRALDLEEKNKERRKLTDKILRHATKQIDALLAEDESIAFLCIKDESYPIGIVGIVAGRLTRQYGRPVGIFREEGKVVRGSFRSVEGLDVVRILHNAKDFLDKYGGHEAAAGAQLSVDQFEGFCECVDQATRALLDDQADFAPVHVVDMRLSAHVISEALVDVIEKMAPYGEGNVEPLIWFEGLTVQSARPVGKTGKHLKLVCGVINTPVVIDVIGFDFGKDADELLPGVTVEVLGGLSYNEWQGRRTIQIMMRDWRHVNT